MTSINRKSLDSLRAKLAERYGYVPHPIKDLEMVGISQNVRSGLHPINGLRIAPAEGSSGWYIWAGLTMSEDDDFFAPLHVAHVWEWCPNVLPYLELPPGWRFLVAPDHEDVWFDPELDLTPK